MAYVQKRNRNGKQTWHARYRDPDGSEKSRTFATQRDATKWLDKVRGDLTRGEYVDPSAGRQLFGPYATAWQSAQVHRPSTTAQIDSHMRNHILPRFEHRPLAAITPSEVQSFVRGLSDSLAPATVEVVYRYFSSIMKAAVADRLLPRSPCVGIRLPKIERARVVPLSVETVNAIAEAIEPRYRASVLFATGTGLRQGEVLGLTVDRVDFLRRVVHVDRQLLTVRGAPKFGPPKTKASRRDVPLPTFVAEVLAEHLATYPPGEDGLVFTNTAGRPLRRQRFGDAWQAAVKRAKVEGVVFHQLRHFYASALISQSASVKVVQARLGHTTAAETLDTYSHLWPDDEDRTRAAIDTVFGVLAAPSRPQVTR